LNDTLTAEGVFDIMNYTSVPFGNAFFGPTAKCPYSEYSGDGIHCWLDECSVANPPSDCFTGEVHCQHGDEECKVNLYEACAIYLHPKEVMTVAEYSYCVESGGDTDVCATQVGLNQVAIKQCVEGEQGKKANAFVGQETASLNPQHTGTPWVLVNGKNINAGNLLAEVCNAYTGARKPAGCRNVNLHKRIRDRVVELSNIKNYNHTCSL